MMRDPAHLDNWIPVVHVGNPQQQNAKAEISHDFAAKRE